MTRDGNDVHDAPTASPADSAPPTIADSTAATAPDAPALVGLAPRYRLGDVIGRGGMGEVVSARDEQIGRSVAIKRLRGKHPSPTNLARFLREARIQGRLEHPAVVPVHELATDDAGRPFFVMKQLAGTTLADVITRLAAGDADAATKFPRQRLLRAFAEICLAIEFAHTRGVIHRDLKPANIVLGDFGETYVLDWGIAKVAGEVDRPASFADVDTAENQGMTDADSVLGTAGYIPPEQIRGDVDLDGRADIYALGCMLFEILALASLHPRGQAGIASALAGIDAQPSVRAPGRDVPPELDAVCVRATAPDRRDRFATAREVGDAIDRFLDGDRDLALRREIVEHELAIARAALASGGGDLPRRAALRAAARALALDPTLREPADMVGRLMLEPPSQVPAEVDAELARHDHEALAASARFGRYVAVAYLLYFPILYWIGFRDTWYLVAGPALAVSIFVIEAVLARKNPYWSGYLTIAANLAMFALLARIATPVLIGAGPAAIIVMLLATHRKLIPTWLLAALAVVAIVSPWLLEAAGVLSPTTTITGRDIVLHTGAEHLDPFATMFGIVLYFATVLAVATLLSRSQDDERRLARRTLQTQAWQLRQLIPKPVSVPP